MKKKNRTFSLDLHPTRIYLDEIILLEEVLRQNCKSMYIDVDDEEYDFDTTSELCSLKKKAISNVAIIAHAPDINIRISDSYARISYQSDDVCVLGVIEKIRQILQGGQSYWNIFLYWKGSVILFLTLTALLIVAEIVLLPHPLKVKLEIANILFLISTFIWILKAVLFSQHSIIYLVRRSERRHPLKKLFFKSSREIIIAVVSSALAAIITKQLVSP